MRGTPKVGVVDLSVFILKYLDLHTLFSLAFLEGIVKIGPETFIYFIQRVNIHYLNFQFQALNIMMNKAKNSAPK